MPWSWYPGVTAWKLIVNKQTRQWGLSYDPARDLGRVKMHMSKPATMIETLAYTLSDEGGNKVRLQLAWEDHVAAVLRALNVSSRTQAVLAVSQMSSQGGLAAWRNSGR